MLIPIVADFNHANDIGRAQGSELAGFKALKDAGFVGVILKARQGIGFGDPAFARRKELAFEAGLCVGAYDFATHDDPVENSKDFLKFAGIDARISYWLDFEDNKASQMSGDQASVMMDATDQATGRATGIYGGNRIIEQISNIKSVLGDSFDQEWWAMHPLWLCQYKVDPALRDCTLGTLCPHLTIPKPWSKWFLLQYTGDGVGPMPHTAPGLENGADLNVYDGSGDDLRAAWALPALPAPAVTA